MTNIVKRSAVAAGLVAAAVGGFALGVGTDRLAAQQNAPRGWLMDLGSDAERFERLQSDLGGFGRAMLEASIRYERMHQAVADANFELAVSYWDGVKGSLDAGVVRRPARLANSRTHLLDAKWAEIKNDMNSRDAAAARAGFMKARAACMSCHEAEKRAYLNNQPLFTKLVF